MTYEKGDPDCMSEQEAKKNIKILFHSTDYVCIEAGAELNIGDKVGIISFKAKKAEGFEKF